MASGQFFDGLRAGDVDPRPAAAPVPMPRGFVRRNDDVRLDAVLTLQRRTSALGRESLAVILPGARATAGSVNEALEIFEEDPPSILRSDIGMPDEDGFALIDAVRSMTDETSLVPGGGRDGVHPQRGSCPRTARGVRPLTW